MIVNSRKEFLENLDLTDKYCAEIGVYRGDFSAMILDKNPLYLYLIDPFNVGKENYISGLKTAYSTQDDWLYVKERFREDKRVIVKRDYSFDVVSTIQNNYFDFIYIDASHLYKDVVRDLKEWFYKLKDGGVIAGHDYMDFEDFGVARAVDEFCNENGFELFLFNKHGGDYALRKSS